MKKCSFKGCDEKHQARGYCKTHHQQKYRYKKPLKKIREVNFNPPAHCKLKNCNRKHHSKGYCKTHYQQQNNGKPLTKIKKQRKPNMSLKETVLWCLKQITLNGTCMEWNKNCGSNGYATATFKGKEHRVGRLVLQYFKGYPKKNQVMMHSCDNRKCINPAHLKWGTVKENNQDKAKKGRARNQYTGKIIAIRKVE